MAVTKGHGNPKWNKDEIILALDLYFQCNGSMPGPADPRVISLSHVLRSFPYHSIAARQNSFRNPDGVAFKLQNLRQLATGKGLGNVSQADRDVWGAFGHDANETHRIASLIIQGIEAVEMEPDPLPDVEFFEGRLVTEAHTRRERNPAIRRNLLSARQLAGSLCCDLCGFKSSAENMEIAKSSFECHHIVPLSLIKETQTKLKDMALMCANCHRMIHRAISMQKRWLSVSDAKIIIFGRNQNT